jgi:hypothetical protein
MPDIETASPAPGQVADVPAPSSEEFGGDTAATPEAETNGQANGNQKPQSAAQKQKRESQFQRVKRQKAEYQKRESEFQAQQAALARERAEFEESKKPKDECTLADLKKFRPIWEEEGRFDVVERADKEIARLEKLEADKVAASKQTIELPRYGTKEHRARWEANELAIRKENPDFMKADTRLDSMVRRIMQSPYGETARDHPDGIWAVYSEAQKELLKEDNQSLGGKVQQLETEIKRLTGLSSIGGGAPGRVGTARVESLADFSKLSSADMLKHLRSRRGSGGMPWL